MEKWEIFKRTRVKNGKEHTSNNFTNLSDISPERLSNIKPYN